MHRNGFGRLLLALLESELLRGRQGTLGQGGELQETVDGGTDQKTTGLQSRGGGWKREARSGFGLKHVLGRTDLIYDVSAAGACRWLEGTAHCCFCSAVKFQGKKVAAFSGGLAPASAHAVR